MVADGTRPRNDMDLRKVPPIVPLPASLEDMLREYPDAIETLKRHLAIYVRDNATSTALIEGAIWMLEDVLSNEVAVATTKLKTAHSAHDDKAESYWLTRQITMYQARSVNGGLKDTQALREYLSQPHSATDDASERYAESLKPEKGMQP